MDIGEEACAIEILKEHDENDCSFCQQSDEKPTELKSDDSADPEEDDGEVIGNNSGKLGRKMEGKGNKKPTDWRIGIANNPSHKLTPNPHHLIPGNESLKQVKDILVWIFKDKGKIEQDIGYDVNNDENGVWLPSNNSMRGEPRWNDDNFKNDFVVKAMDAAAAHFHDRHEDPYSKFVRRLLQKMADRINGIESHNANCPYVAEKDSGDKFKPPLALVKRLNKVSDRLKNRLTTSAEPTPFIYTSKLVREYWKKKGLPDPKAL